jgi:hypothetical protein
MLAVIVFMVMFAMLVMPVKMIVFIGGHRILASFLNQLLPAFLRVLRVSVVKIRTTASS